MKQLAKTGLNQLFDIVGSEIVYIMNVIEQVPNPTQELSLVEMSDIKLESLTREDLVESVLQFTRWVFQLSSQGPFLVLNIYVYTYVINTSILTKTGLRKSIVPYFKLT